MRAVLAVLFGTALLAAVPSAADTPAKSSYEIVFDRSRDVSDPTDEDIVIEGKKQKKLIVTVRFTIKGAGDVSKDYKDYKIAIKEDANRVKEVDVPHPKLSDDVAVVLAMDVSGSMREGGRIAQ